jgi:MFS family permease
LEREDKKMRSLIGNKQLFFLFASNLVVLFVGMGLFPLLPLYATQFGATRTVIGIYYAVMYAASVLGTMATGWLARRVPPRNLFIAAGALGVAALALLGQATALWQVVLFTAVIWFGGAITIPLVGVFTGLVADGDNRGKSFTMMYLAFPLGAVFGGTTVGQLVGWQGYPVMFAVLAAVWAILPVIGLLGLRDERFSRLTSSAGEKTEGSAPLGRTFYLLLVAFLLSAMAVNVGRLGTSLSMQNFNFSASAVSSTATVSGLVAIPVTILIGVLADRLGHRRLLTVGYVLAGGGALALVTATQLWQFWLAATLMLVAFVTNMSVASAFATSILEPRALSRGLPMINALDSVGSIASFAGAGFVMDTFGATPLFLTAAGLAVVAVVQLSQLGQGRSHGTTGFNIRKVVNRVANRPAFRHGGASVGH